MLARVDWSNCSIEIMLPPLAVDQLKTTIRVSNAKSGLSGEFCHHEGCFGGSPLIYEVVIHTREGFPNRFIGFSNLAAKVMAVNFL